MSILIIECKRFKRKALQAFRNVVHLKYKLFKENNFACMHNMASIFYEKILHICSFCTMPFCKSKLQYHDLGLGHYLTIATQIRIAHLSLSNPTL